MPQAVMTITLDDEDHIDVSVDFDPPLQQDEPNPLCHHAMVAAFEALKDWARD